MSRIDDALDRILVRSKGELFSRIEQVSHEISIENTQAMAYCYALKIDANGYIRIHDLVEFIDDKLLEYAIPKKEIDEAKAYFNETNSPYKIAALRTKAKTLFTDLEKTGEGGEVLLYVLTQEILKLPQLLSKMSLKTSGKLHYQGADGIHLGYDDLTENLSLYWGESKMYQNISDAISSCFDSIKGFLLDTQGCTSTQERDLQLITSNINTNINDTELEDLLVRFFNKDDDFSNHVIYKGICFIGFDSDKYPSSEDLSKTTETVKLQIEKELYKWHNIIGEKIFKHKNLEMKEIHVFLMPFPSVAEFRKYFLERIQK